MRRLLGAPALGLALWSLAGPASAQEPTAAGQGVAVADLARAVLADPNVAFLLLVVGIVGVVAEAYHPGSFVPGIAGLASLSLAVVGLGALPTNWWAVGLIVLALGLLLAEAHLPTHGVLGAVAVVVFLLAGCLLYSPLPPLGPADFGVGEPAPEIVEVNRWLLLAVGAGAAGFFLLVVRAGLQVRRLPRFDPLGRLPGGRAVATSPLVPFGTVRIRHELWTALSDDGTVEPGEPVEVVAREGLTLRVRRLAPAGARAFEGIPSAGEVRPGVRVAWRERIT